MKKKKHTINAIIAYLYSYYAQQESVVKVFSPYQQNWEDDLQTVLRTTRFSKIFVSLKWWHELYGAIKLLEYLQKYGYRKEIIIGGHTSVTFKNAIYQRFPGVQIYRSYPLPATLSLSKEIFEKGIVSGYVPLKEGCNEKCYFCGTFQVPKRGWLRSPISIARDLEILSKNKEIEIFFDSDAESLLLEALKLTNNSYHNKVYYFFWRKPNYNLIAKLCEKFQKVSICLDVVSLDDSAKEKLIRKGLLKRAMTIEEVIKKMEHIHKWFDVSIDISFAVGHPFESKDNIKRSLDNILSTYMRSSISGTIKATPLHVLPNTLFNHLDTTYNPKWKNLDDFLFISQSIYTGRDYYEVVLDPPDGYPLGFYNRHTSDAIITTYQWVIHTINSAND